MIKKKNEHLYLIDICRGIAAFCIVIFHYRIFYNPNINTASFEKNNQPFYNILFPAYEFGWIAVQFFFTISGFIFYYLYLKDIYNKNISQNKKRKDIELNVKTSAKFLAKLYKRYGDWGKVCGYYNTGKPIINDYAHYAVNNKNYKSKWVEVEL